jgi:hypothetical protein
MNDPNPRLEHVGALVMSSALLLSIVSTVYEIATHDFEVLGAIRVGHDVNYIFWLAVLALLLADTDVAKAIREGSFLRAQVRCWGLWWLLQYAVLMVQLLPFKHVANQSFLVAGCLLAFYSVIAAFRPNFPPIFESSS